MQGTTSVGNSSIPLILSKGSAYFVKKSNINCESCILIGWLDKSNNRIGKDESACMCSSKPLQRLGFGAKNVILSLVFRGATLLSLYQASFWCITDNVCILLITMAEKDPEVIEVPDNDDGDDWQDMGAINVKEAVAAYKEKVDKVFEMMSFMIVDDHKDAVCTSLLLASRNWLQSIGK